MFKVSEVLKATAGKLLNGSEDTAVNGIAIDSRVIKPGDAFIAIKGDKFDGHQFIDDAIRKGASCIICGPETADQRPETAVVWVGDTTKALGDLARFHRQRFDIPVITVTGSNGKTTTKEMIAHVLCNKFNVLKNIGTQNNQIGLPMTILNLNKSHDLIVLEAGTNHPGEIEYLSRIAQPDIAVITNIGPSHLKYLKDIDQVFIEKINLLKNLSRSKIALLNADDNLLGELANKKDDQVNIFSFGIRRQADIFASEVQISGSGVKFIVNKKHEFKLNTPGWCNVYNALVAILIARIFGIEHNDIASRLDCFDFPKSRLKFVEFEDIKFIDDTYNSNPLSLRYALDVLAHMEVKGRKIFVMGDMLELGPEEEFFHRQAGENAARFCDALIAVGKLSALTAQVAQDAGISADKIFHCQNATQARQILRNKLNPNKEDIVLVKGSRSMKMENIFNNP